MSNWKLTDTVTVNSSMKFVETIVTTICWNFGDEFAGPGLCATEREISSATAPAVARLWPRDYRDYGIIGNLASMQHTHFHTDCRNLQIGKR